MHFEERMEMVLQELGPRSWDLLVFTETWREEDYEIFVTDAGHTWCGAGGSLRANGVGMLLHKRWSYTNFLRSSDRVCALDIKISSKRLRAIGVYFPHSGYKDEDVEAVYAQVEDLLLHCQTTKDLVAIAGDFNADIGLHPESDTDERDGQNLRGQRLLQW